MLFLIYLIGGFFAATDLGILKGEALGRFILCIFIGWVFIVIWGISKLASSNNSKSSLPDAENDQTLNSSSCKCPYCNEEYIINEDGYYHCNSCNNDFRYRSGKSYKESETVNPLYEMFVILSAYVSKADGIVTDNEISVLKNLLTSAFKLTSLQVEYCAEIFNDYKKLQYNNAYIIEMQQLIADSSYDDDEINCIRSLLKEFLLDVAFADNDMSYEQYKIISDVSTILKIPMSDFDKTKSEYLNDNPEKDLSKYYEILHLKEGCGQKALKDAYRALVKIYHPDAQSSKNLPPEIINDITEKFKLIQEAYNVLLNHEN